MVDQVWVFVSSVDLLVNLNFVHSGFFVVSGGVWLFYFISFNFCTEAVARQQDDKDTKFNV
jgi:hypothetical protein